MYGGRTVTVVFPAFNEEQHIRQAVEEFLAPGVVDDVIVVDNNSRDRTAEEAGPPRPGWSPRRRRATATPCGAGCAKPPATS